jgi:hypothetical protein
MLGFIIKALVSGVVLQKAKEVIKGIARLYELQEAEKNSKNAKELVKKIGETIEVDSRNVWTKYESSSESEKEEEYLE